MDVTESGSVGSAERVENDGGLELPSDNMTAQDSGQGPDMSTQTFNILIWNIDGITNKLNDKDFINYLLSFDIFCVLETWLQTLSDDISSMFSGHIRIFVPEKKLSRFGRAMGGIILFINKTYEKYIRNIEISCEFGIFLQVKKEFLQLDKDLILSCMYLPPQGSPFYDELQVKGSV